MSGLALCDLGERRIIREILAPRYANATRFGDDCASIPLAGSGPDLLVATTDPCPPPMAAALGFGDLYYMGWLLATLNLSDLAAAGAEPLGLLTSLTLPADMPVDDFVRLLDGIDACCAGAATRVVGGNLKEAPRVDVSATALGRCPQDELLTRDGAQAGDRVLVLGDLGAFWAGALGYREGLIDEGNADHALLRNVLTPVPKVQVMRPLAMARLLRASIDNSDGLYPSLKQLGDSSGAGILVEADAITYAEDVSGMAAKLRVEPLRLALGWGDWQVLATCASGAVGDVRRIAERHGVPVHDIGSVVQEPGVRVRLNGREGPLMPLDSERFTTGSWFSSGLDGYVSILREAPLIKDS